MAKLSLSGFLDQRSVEETGVLPHLSRHPALMAAILAVSTAVSGCCEDQKSKPDSTGSSSSSFTLTAVDGGNAGSDAGRGESTVGKGESSPKSVETINGGGMRFVEPEMKTFAAMPTFMIADTVNQGTPEYESHLARMTKKPAALAENKYAEICKKYAARVEKELNQNLIPRLSENPLKNTEVMGQFLSAIAGLLESMNPAIKADMEAFGKTWDHSHEALIGRLNEYLIRGGIYMDMQNRGNGLLRLDVFKITGAKYVNMTDDQGTISVPLLEVGKSMVPKQLSGINGDYVALCDATFSRMIVLKENVSAASSRMKKRVASFEGFADVNSSPDFERQVVNDYIRHEATHVYLSRRFPKAGNALDMRIRINQPITINVGADSEVRLGGDLPPVVFHELCAVGMQIAKSELPFPVSQMTYTGAETNAEDTYGLTIALMPLVSTMALHEGPDKSVLRKGLQQTGELPFDQIFKAIRKQPDQIQYNRTTGRALFTLGYRALERAEKQKL